MVFVYPLAPVDNNPTDNVNSSIAFNYWTGIDLGNCASTGEEIPVTTSKQELNIQGLSGDSNGYDFCHYDFIANFLDNSTLKLIMDLKQ